MSALIDAWARATQREVERSHRLQLDRDFIRQLLPWMERFSRYFDAEVRGFENIPEGPVMLVANHSGGMMTPDTSAFMAHWYRERGLDAPLVGLAFDAAFGIPGFRTVLRRLGLVPARRANAARALGQGAAVLVYPGGAHEVFRPWSMRNRIDFGGHKGFVSLALQLGVPVVPVVGHGGHETFVVLARGDRVGRSLGLDKVRVNVCPLVFQLPWGISPPAAPNLPLPAKITIQVGEPLDWAKYGSEAAQDPDRVDRCYDEITGRMQAILTELAEETPRPLLTRLRRWAGRE